MLTQPLTPAPDDAERRGDILLERHGASGPKRFPFGTPAFDRGMLMAHILHRLVRRHSLNRRIGGVNS